MRKDRANNTDELKTPLAWKYHQLRRGKLFHLKNVRHFISTPITFEDFLKVSYIHKQTQPQKRQTLHLQTPEVNQKRVATQIKNHHPWRQNYPVDNTFVNQ